MGFRSLLRHADAAFLSSVFSTSALQCSIWPRLTPQDVLAETAVQEALASISPRLPRSLARQLAAGESIPQRALSRALDRTQADAELLSAEAPTHIKAHLQLVSAAGADAWLHAIPSTERNTNMDSELFRIALARRLRLRLLDAFATCSCCGAGMDVYMDHALVCSCGGIGPCGTTL